MSTVINILVLLLLVGSVAILERSYRRTARLTNAPFGADLRGDRDLQRTLDDLAALGQPSVRTSARGGLRGTIGRLAHLH